MKSFEDIHKAIASTQPKRVWRMSSDSARKLRHLTDKAGSYLYELDGKEEYFCGIKIFFYDCEPVPVLVYYFSDNRFFEFKVEIE